MRRHVIVLSAAVLAGCASAPKPVEQMAGAETTISQATPAAARYQPQMLREAQAKLDRARSAMAQDDNVEAKRLAEEAEADARLAWASSEHQRAQQAAAEVERGLDVLKKQLERKTQ